MSLHGHICLNLLTYSVPGELFQEGLVLSNKTIAQDFSAAGVFLTKFRKTSGVENYQQVLIMQHRRFEPCRKKTS
ncbi:MAG TPA: hypothetical protein DCM07_13330 [Planctomycetaceae bacterium]|nr:hypothetical protein [Gimesia sp.]HAH45806.1 hypothetical protein [Planctomycetaceae bacterium]HBL47281.1 hypothetical protein [Planctomycetaceae bacterium]|tara:strand:+ start:368 stop:592 length:225 start_codon:yes stop_codon:yes gene_type:complete